MSFVRFSRGSLLTAVAAGALALTTGCHHRHGYVSETYVSAGPDYVEPPPVYAAPPPPPPPAYYVAPPRPVPIFRPAPCPPPRPYFYGYRHERYRRHHHHHDDD
ncbi:MAG: hypothetical protein U1A27_07605 [Phycisphaerae bacterium]